MVVSGKIGFALCNLAIWAHFEDHIPYVTVGVVHLQGNVFLSLFLIPLWPEKSLEKDHA
jgi:hypothetical protein